MRIAMLMTIVAAVITAPLAGASAAPQALGLVATGAPVELDCAGGECWVELSAFCLQQARESPTPGTTYRPIGDALTLVAVAADGKTLRFAGAEHLTITSARGFTAVRISMPTSALAALGAVRAGVKVGAKVSLVPVPVAGDPWPQSPEEIAAASGALREVGTRLVDNGGPVAGAARLMNALVNGLPDRGRTGVELGDRVWRKTVTRHDLDAESIARAAEAYGLCRKRAERGYYYSIRRCVEQQHDELMSDLNRRYWNALVGS